MIGFVGAGWRTRTPDLLITNLKFNVSVIVAGASKWPFFNNLSFPAFPICSCCFLSASLTMSLLREFAEPRRWGQRHGTEEGSNGQAIDSTKRAVDAAKARHAIDMFGMRDCRASASRSLRPAARSTSFSTNSEDERANKPRHHWTAWGVNADLSQSRSQALAW